MPLFQYIENAFNTMEAQLGQAKTIIDRLNAELKIFRDKEKSIKKPDKTKKD